MQRLKVDDEVRLVSNARKLSGNDELGNVATTGNECKSSTADTTDHPPNASVESQKPNRYLSSQQDAFFSIAACCLSPRVGVGAGIDGKASDKSKSPTSITNVFTKC